MTAITITLAGVPVAKGRPRMTKAGHAYTPAKTREYEVRIRSAAAHLYRCEAKLFGPVAVEVIAEMPIPASWSKAKRIAALAWTLLPTGKPDADNLAKTATDALNGIAYADDSQITKLTVSKRYAAEPMLSIRVTPLAPEKFRSLSDQS